MSFFVSLSKRTGTAGPVAALVQTFFGQRLLMFRWVVIRALDKGTSRGRLLSRVSLFVNNIFQLIFISTLWPCLLIFISGVLLGGRSACRRSGLSFWRDQVRGRPLCGSSWRWISFMRGWNVSWCIGGGSAGVLRRPSCAVGADMAVAFLTDDVVRARREWLLATGVNDQVRYLFNLKAYPNWLLASSLTNMK